MTDWPDLLEPVALKTSMCGAVLAARFPVTRVLAAKRLPGSSTSAAPVPTRGATMRRTLGAASSISCNTIEVIALAEALFWLRRCGLLDCA